ncbi:MAG: rRNA pseudouridine synthase, partial [Bacteroidetes bacterium]
MLKIKRYLCSIKYEKMGLRKKPYNEDKKGDNKNDSKRGSSNVRSFDNGKPPRVVRTEKSSRGFRNEDADKSSSRSSTSTGQRLSGDTRKTVRPSTRGAYGEKKTSRPEFSDRPKKPVGGRSSYSQKDENSGYNRRPTSTRGAENRSGENRRFVKSDRPQKTTSGRAPYVRKSEGDDKRPSKAGNVFGGAKRTSYKDDNKRDNFRTSKGGYGLRGPSKDRFSSGEERAERGIRSNKDGFSNEGPTRRGKTGRPYMVKGAKARDLKAKSDEMLDSIAPDIVRLNRFISNAGICSRREADDLISAGLVSVNGEVVTEMGYKVKPGDEVKYNKQRLSWEQKVYLLMNKPKDFITTSDDPDGRKIIMDLIKEPRLPRVYPVGRLDRNTTGVILLTNDGELAQRLTHPKYNITKIYKAVLNKSFAAKDLQELGSNGVELEDGPIKPDVIGIPSPNERNVVLVQIHSGRNRIIHRMFEAMGYLVD